MAFFSTREYAPSMQYLTKQGVATPLFTIVAKVIIFVHLCSSLLASV